jgi:hypothetical protein
MLAFMNAYQAFDDHAVDTYPLPSSAGSVKAICDKHFARARCSGHYLGWRGAIF